MPFLLFFRAGLIKSIDKMWASVETELQLCTSRCFFIPDGRRLWRWQPLGCSVGDGWTVGRRFSLMLQTDKEQGNATTRLSLLLRLFVRLCGGSVTNGDGRRAVGRWDDKLIKYLMGTYRVVDGLVSLLFLPPSSESRHPASVTQQSVIHL